MHHRLEEPCEASKRVSLHSNGEPIDSTFFMGEHGAESKQKRIVIYSKSFASCTGTDFGKSL
jgi:hypothetical protein